MNRYKHINKNGQEAKTKGGKMKTITKDQAVEKIVNSGGQFFNVNFMKKDGSARSMTARKGVKKGVKGVGLAFDPKNYALISVWDTVKKQFRFISAEKIFGLAIDGVEYIVE